ncbi:hypothetical protein J3E69DRAFT_246259 [Trichoderma sp. SZMC 28015]
MSVKQDNMSALLCKFSRRHPRPEAPKCNLLQQNRGIGFRRLSECGLPSSFTTQCWPKSQTPALFSWGVRKCRALPAGLVPLPLVQYPTMTQPGPDRSFAACRCFCPIQPQYSGSAPAIVYAAGTRLVLIHPNPGTILLLRVKHQCLCLCSGNKRRHGSRIRIRIRTRIRGPAGSRQRVLYAPQLSRCINPPKRQFKLQSEILIARGQPRLRRPRLQLCRTSESCAAAFAPFPSPISHLPPTLILISPASADCLLPKAGLAHFDPGDQ